MFKRFMDINSICNAMFCMNEPLEPDTGEGGGTPPAEPAPGAGDEPPASFETPEGQVLISKEDMESYRYYQQFGSPKEVYDRHIHYDELTKNPAPAPAPDAVDPARTQELEQVKTVMLEVFPFLKDVPGVMEQINGHMIGLQKDSNAFTDSAMVSALKLAEADEIELKTQQDKNMFLQIMATAIKGDPTAAARFKAGDISVVKETYDSVKGTYYNKGNGEAPPVPSHKIGRTKPIKKGGTPGGIVEDDKVAKDFNEAGDNAFARLQSLVNE